MPTKPNETTDQNAKNFLTEAEMKKFLASARQGKPGVRDYCLMLMEYRHGLRVSELIDIRLKDLDKIFVFRRVSKGDNLMGAKITEQAGYNVVLGYVEKLKPQSIAPHNLRRTFAKLAHKGGSPIDQI